MTKSQTSTGDPPRVVAGGGDDGSNTARKGSVPLETTSFVGRERELGELEGLLGRTRLLTLVGVGGSGKIGRAGQDAFRRALEPAWRALGEKAGEATWEAGRAMTLEEALDLAYAEPGTMPDLPSDSILSARELEVLSLVADGLSDAEVAEKLYVSPRTVSGHLRSAYRKLGVKSRTAAVKKAGELGLI